MQTGTPATQKKPAVFTQVGKLEPATSGHNLVVKVVTVKVVVDRTRATTPQSHKVAEVVVGDDTGCVTLAARNNQIDVLIPGNTVVLRNAKVDMFNGYMRLAVDKWGLIKPSPQPATFDVNLQNDKSAVEYELVPS